MSPVLTALLIPFLGTALGSAFVFFMKKDMPAMLQKVLLGFASGVMVAASVWSLIIPSIEMGEGTSAVIPPTVGLLAGFAGILTVARAGHAEPTYGVGYEMDAIAACFIGGASAYGGVGKITGVIIGSALMGVINQGMSIMGISANYQSAVKGVVLLVAVLVDVLTKKENA